MTTQAEATAAVSATPSRTVRKLFSLPLSPSLGEGGSSFIDHNADDMNKIDRLRFLYARASTMVFTGILLVFVCFSTNSDGTNGHDRREIREIIIHCSATPEGKDYSVEQIAEWHRQRGFSQVGYNYIISLSGAVHAGRPLTMAGAHCKGHNAQSIGICYIGGLAKDGKTPKDTRTEEQKKAMVLLLTQLHAQYPKATLHGHREFSNKACPCFNCHEYDYIFKDSSV